MSDLEDLARMIHARNAIDDKVSKIIGRPAEKGHVGEYIASKVFGITLEHAATQKAFDGRLAVGPLAGKTANIKWYAKREGYLDTQEAEVPDFYLVLTGPQALAASSRGTTRPWLIENVYLFPGPDFVNKLRGRGVKVGDASSVRVPDWDEAEIYPRSNPSLLELSDKQRGLLALFRKIAAGSSNSHSDLAGPA